MVCSTMSDMALGMPKVPGMVIGMPTVPGMVIGVPHCALLSHQS